MKQPDREGDPEAGLWSTDFTNPPRQVMRGWVPWFERGPGNQLYALEGRGDLDAILWRVSLTDGRRERVGTLPLMNSYWIVIDLFPNFHFDVSPDGRRVVFSMLSAQASVGMLERAK